MISDGLLPGSVTELDIVSLQVNGGIEYAAAWRAETDRVHPAISELNGLWAAGIRPTCCSPKTKKYLMKFSGAFLAVFAAVAMAAIISITRRLRRVVAHVRSKPSTRIKQRNCMPGSSRWMRGSVRRAMSHVAILEIAIHVCAPVGSRIEGTSTRFDATDFVRALGGTFPKS